MTRAEDWWAIAERAYDRFRLIEGRTTQQAMALAYAAQTAAWLDGWHDPDALDYLDRLYALRNPDGGWGLNVATDAFQDGTVNPASMTYTVTLAGHVGPPLVDAWQAGVVPRSDIQKIVDLLVGMPRFDDATGLGICYSRSLADLRPGYCVHNVSAGAAAFLYQLRRLGFGPPVWLISGVTKRTLAGYNHKKHWWPYRDGVTAREDRDHGSYTAEAVYTLAEPVGYAAAATMMQETPDDDPRTPLVGMRLAGLGAPIWSQLGDRWLPRADQFVTDQADNPARLAQAAYYCMRAARAA